MMGSYTLSRGKSIFRHGRGNTTISFPTLSSAHVDREASWQQPPFCLVAKALHWQLQKVKVFDGNLRDIPLATEFDVNGSPSNFRDENLGQK